MSGACRIRPAQLGDADALGELVLRVGGFRAHAGRAPDQVRAVVRANVRETLAGGRSTLLVAEDGDGLVGWAQVHWLHELSMPGPEGYLTELFVDEGRRGGGAGSALHDRIVAEARERGAYRLSLLNGVERESYRRGYYAARGWEERDDVAAFALWLGD